MKNTSLVLGDASGNINLGATGLNWEYEDVGDMDTVLLDNITIDGDFESTGRISLRGCFDTVGTPPVPYNMQTLCITGADSGSILKGFCTGCTVTVIESCP